MFSLKVHNILDYIVGAVLVVAPFAFGFAELDTARNVFMLGGFFLLLYSLLTNYEFAALRILPVGVHMALDVLLGIVVMTAPWIFDYRGLLTPSQEYLHYGLGVGVFALVGFTREKTEAAQRHQGVSLRSQHATAGRL